MLKEIVLILVIAVCAQAGRFAYKGVNSLFDPRIIGGEDAGEGKCPCIISLQTELVSTTHNCGGCILAEEWVITAAHCVVNPPTLGHFVVVGGEHDFDTEDGAEQRSRVSEIYIHPDFGTDGISPNDIALIRLATPLVLNERVQIIALPEAGTIPTGNATLFGWGSTGGVIFPQMPSILQTAELPIVEYDKCHVVYNDTPLAETNICTGPLEGGRAACGGDSGGPLVQYSEDGKPTLIGLVSWQKSPCAAPNSPTVYTRVSAFIDFILSIITKDVN